jgi:tetratricopeptide (TPR) repeat protein
MNEPDAIMIYTAQLGGIRYEQGALDELGELLEPAVDDYPGVSGFRAALALMHAEADRFDEARALFRAEAERGFDAIGRDQSETTTLVLWADIAFQLGDASAAEELYARLLPARDGTNWNGAVAYNAIAHYLGGLAALLGRYEEADEHFERAIALQRQIPAPLWMARTFYWYGRTLLERPAEARGADAERARDLIAESVALASSHGAAVLERRGRAMLESEQFSLSS